MVLTFMLVIGTPPLLLIVKEFEKVAVFITVPFVGVILIISFTVGAVVSNVRVLVPVTVVVFPE